MEFNNQYKQKQMENQNIVWGEVPAQRKRKEEKYTTPVVTMSAIEKVGAGRKFTFNKAAQEILGVVGEERVSFGFTPDGQHIYIRKATGDAGFQLTKTCTISDKRTYEYIVKRLSLNTETENDFDLIDVSATIGAGVVEMVLKTNTQEAVTFTTTDLGEVSDDVDLSADLSSIPETPEGGNMYSEAEVVEESPFVEEETTTEEPIAEATDEDVW